jgi:hypothetical protein
VLSVTQCGLHDIENQLIFKSKPRFIFHDSRGFECGSVDETEKVKSFITKRAESTKFPEQLHAIWCVVVKALLPGVKIHWINGRYCLPTDTERPLLEADKKFFDEYGSGKGR